MLHLLSGPVFSYKLRYIVGFWLVEMAISTNQKPMIYRNLYDNTGPGIIRDKWHNPATKCSGHVVNLSTIYIINT